MVDGKKHRKKEKVSENKEPVCVSGNQEETEGRYNPKEIREWILCLVAILGVVCMFYGTFLARNVRDGIIRILNESGRNVVERTGWLSEQLADRGYLIDEFGGNGICTVIPRTVGAPGSEVIHSVQLKAEQRILEDEQDCYAGINIFGNQWLTGYWKPIDLSKFSALRLTYRYPDHPKNKWFLKLKNINNLETAPIYIPAGDQPGGTGEFVIRLDGKQISRLLSGENKTPLVSTISIATDSRAWGDEIEILDVSFE